MNLLEMLESAKTKFNYADTPLLVDAAIFEMCAIERRIQEAEEEGVAGRDKRATTCVNG